MKRHSTALSVEDGIYEAAMDITTSFFTLAYKAGLTKSWQCDSN